MNDNPNLVQIQEQLRNSVVNTLGVNIENIKKEITTTLGHQVLVLKGVQQAEGGHVIRFHFTIKQVDKKRFKIGGTIYDNSDVYTIGKDIKVQQVESLPNILSKEISQVRMHVPRKTKKLGIF